MIAAAGVATGALVGVAAGPGPVWSDGREIGRGVGIALTTSMFQV